MTASVGAGVMKRNNQQVVLQGCAALAVNIFSFSSLVPPPADFSPCVSFHSFIVSLGSSPLVWSLSNSMSFQLLSWAIGAEAARLKMLWIVLLLSAFIPSSHASSSCDAGPISIPIQDTQVLDDVEGSYMIGLRTKLGTPAQDILMLPWAYVMSNKFFSANSSDRTRLACCQPVR